MVLVYAIEKKYFDTFICHRLGGYDKLHHFCQPINHNKNGITRLGTWEVFDEIHIKKWSQTFMNLKRL
jgi:hypothetical protein